LNVINDSQRSAAKVAALAFPISLAFLAYATLRKLECTYNAEREDYHPHFHIAVDGRLQANAMLRRWLDLHPEASPQAQDVRPCDTGALKELFKYFTKIITKRPGISSHAVPSALALDVIFSAMRGRRVYQPMGFRVGAAPQADENADVGTSEGTSAHKRLGEFIQWELDSGATRLDRSLHG